MKKIAILILAHKNPSQVHRLCSRFDAEHYDVFLHIDKKTPVESFTEVFTGQQSNVYFVNKRIDTQLVDFSLVDATMELVKSACNNGEYLYYALLTGQDYTIKSADYIYDYLSANYPMDYIDKYGCEEAYNKGVLWTGRLGNMHYSQRIRRILRKIVGFKFYYSKSGKMTARLLANVFDRFVSLFTMSPRKEIARTRYTYSFGSHFWILTDRSIKFLLDAYQNDKDINKIFRHIAAPEESYFQTVLSAHSEMETLDQFAQFSNMDDAMDNAALRLIKWYENGKQTNGHPAIWRKEDAEYIKSRRALFARKFDKNVDSEILDILDNL